MDILLIAIAVLLFALVVYLSNKYGGIVDRFYKKDVDSHISMHHDPNRGRDHK